MEVEMTQIDEPNLDEQIELMKAEFYASDLSPKSFDLTIGIRTKMLIANQVREELTNLKIARLNLDKITTDHADGYQMAIDDMNRHIDNRIKELKGN